MRFFNSIAVPAVMISVLAINACKKQTIADVGPIKPKVNNLAPGQDTSYTDLESRILIIKWNHSDTLPARVWVSFLKNSNPARELIFQVPMNGSPKEDSLIFNGGNDYISQGNLPINHSDTSVTFAPKNSDRLKIHQFAIKNLILIAKPADKNADLTVQWVYNDIPGPYDPEKERQRANATINAMNKGHPLIWVGHP
jgi:hypothetical protein